MAGFADSTPYSTVEPFLSAVGARPTYLPLEDQDRVGSYKVYEDIYWGVPDTFKIVLRGTDAEPIYVPTARTIIEATHRFVAPMPSLAITPSLLGGSDAAVQLAIQQFDVLFKREKFWSRFAGNKRYGHIRGDWLWHVIGNPLKAPGSKIDILPIDPASYVPEMDDDDLDHILAVNLIEPFVGADTKQYVKRQRYWRDDPTSTSINSACAVWLMEEFIKEDQGPPVRVVIPPTVLPPQITAFPVYHIKNWEEPQNPFGSSSLRGFERILTAISQGATDEDLSLALDGLGVYATDSPPPEDPDNPGKDGPWVIGPGRVVEIPSGKFFNRVPGLGSITPYQDHIKFFIDAIKEASGTPDVAIGKVDVSIAESGIALQLHLAPKLTDAREKNDLITDTLAHMFFDLKAFSDAYEGVNLDGAEIMPTFGSPIPENKKEELETILTIHSASPALVTSDWTRTQLTRITGLDFSTVSDDQINAFIVAQADALAGTVDVTATDVTVTDASAVTA